VNAPRRGTSFSELVDRLVERTDPLLSRAERRVAAVREALRIGATAPPRGEPRPRRVKPAPIAAAASYRPLCECGEVADGLDRHGFPACARHR
jgi:hypothetical protein